jgi:hypothetical protein
MKVVLTSTTMVVELNGVPCRIWEGATESGVPVHAYIVRVAAPVAADQHAFQAELLHCEAPSPGVAAIPLRMIL